MSHAGRALVRGLLATLAAAAGAAAGLLGSFVHPLEAAGLPVGLVVALALSGSVFVTAGLVVGRAGVAAAGAGWLVAVLLFSTQRPEGDLVVPATASGYGWLLGGFLLALGALLPRYRREARPRRSTTPPSAPADAGR